jgi:hypothetical protein
MPPEEFGRLDALLNVGLGLARRARSGRLLLARIADSIDLGWIPTPWGDEIAAELEAAEAAASEPLSDREVHRVLRDAWGTRWGDELDDLEADPVAVTPGAQVHRASLDGELVAVKVLRPGLAASVRQDMALLELLAGPLGSAFPGVDPAGATREFRERVLEELDLEHEAGSSDNFTGRCAVIRSSACPRPSPGCATRACWSANGPTESRCGMRPTRTCARRG